MSLKLRRPALFSAGVVPALGALMISAAPSAVLADDICLTHTVQSGDTLRKIARQYYDVDEENDWKIIFEANGDQLRNGPDAIFIGMQLKLPCLPDSAVQPIQQATVQATAPEVTAPTVDTDSAAPSVAVTVEDAPTIEPADTDTSALAAAATADAAGSNDSQEIGQITVQTSVTAPTLSLDGNFQAAPITTVIEPAPVPEPVIITAETGDATEEPSVDVDPVVAQSNEQEPEGPRPITLVTGNNYPPFTDESLPGRGFFTLLVQTALLRAEPERPYEIKFVNDWDAHLDALMPSLAFDASFPWAQPDCSQMARLSDAERDRCVTYRFTNSFYDVVDGFFSRTGSGFEEATDYADLNGTVICRPEGYTSSHLDLAGLKEPLVTFVRPVEVSACFDMLMRADVDVVSIETQVADAAIAEMGLRDVVTMNPNLAAVRPLTLIVHNENENADEFIELLNRGLQIMRDSGEWYAITSKALMQQAEAES